MRVSIVMPALDIGGVERVMLHLASGFTSHGLSVDIVVANSSGPLKNEIPCGVHLVDLQASRVLFTLPQLAGYLRQTQPDVILSAKDYQNIVTLLAMKIARYKGKVIVTNHIDISADWAWNKSFKSRLIPYFVRYTYPWATYIVTVSRGARQSLARVIGLPAERITVIYNPVISSEMLVKSEEPLNHSWFAPGEPPVILSAGRLTQQKDYPTLINAFAIVREKHKARLVILGDGEDRKKLEKLVEKLGLIGEVDLPGFVENPYKFMKRAAVFVLSSLWEGLPTALIEAMALGCPVISTNCPSGPVEILEAGKWGLLVPVGDVDRLAKAILQVFESPPDREELRRRGLEFSVDRAVQRYLELICGVNTK